MAAVSAAPLPLMIVTTGDIRLALPELPGSSSPSGESESPPARFPAGDTAPRIQGEYPWEGEGYDYLVER